MTCVLKAIALDKNYDQGPHQIDVLSAVDFCVSAGERVAIVGASGSGKSTLLNLLGGLDQPSGGQVEVMQQPFSVLSDNRRGRIRNQHLGFVYQFHHLLAEFSALENVAMPCLIAGMSKTDAHKCALALLQTVGLGARVDHKPAALSGGERQRVAIARALANQPGCVLMDEPTGNLDSKNAAMVQQLMLDLAKQLNTAFVIVTHDENLADGLDKTYLLHDSKLILQGVSVS